MLLLDDDDEVGGGGDRDEELLELSFCKLVAVAAEAAVVGDGAVG